MLDLEGKGGLTQQPPGLSGHLTGGGSRKIGGQATAFILSSERAMKSISFTELRRINTHVQ